MREIFENKTNSVVRALPKKQNKLFFIREIQEVLVEIVCTV